MRQLPITIRIETGDLIESSGYEAGLRVQVSEETSRPTCQAAHPAGAITADEGISQPAGQVERADMDTQTSAPFKF